MSHRQTCNNDRVCPGWSKFQCHLMLMFVYSQVVLIGKSLEAVNTKKISKISMLYEVAYGLFSTCAGGLQYLYRYLIRHHIAIVTERLFLGNAAQHRQSILYTLDDKKLRKLCLVYNFLCLKSSVWTHYNWRRWLQIS